MISRYLERVILGENRGLLSWVIRGLLWPFTLIYRTGLAFYLWVYSSGLRKKHRLSVPVISVGNLTFGGTGKTPAVQAICRMFIESGKRVVVLSRGHGGSAKGSLVVSDGKSILCTAAESGDEPMMLALSLPGTPVIVGKDRRITGELACREFGPDVVVLDDGLQYWQLHRDLDVVVLNAARLFGSGFVMPMGDMREPVSGLKRAGAVLLANSRGMETRTYSGLVDKLKRLGLEAPVYRGAHVPVCFRKVDTGEVMGIDWAKGRSITAFCGIGRPRAFIEMLEGLGAWVGRSVVFPDHHAYTRADMRSIESEFEASGAHAIVTTSKDLARLGDGSWNVVGRASGPATPSPGGDGRGEGATHVRRAGQYANMYVLEIAFEVEDSRSFAEYIDSKINSPNEGASSR